MLYDMHVTLTTDTDADRDDYESDDETVDTGSKNYKSYRHYDDQIDGFKLRKKKVYLPVFVPEKEKKKSKNVFFLHCL